MKFQNPCPPVKFKQIWSCARAHAAFFGKCRSIDSDKPATAAAAEEIDLVSQGVYTHKSKLFRRVMSVVTVVPHGSTTTTDEKINLRDRTPLSDAGQERVELKLAGFYWSVSFD